MQPQLLKNPILSTELNSIKQETDMKIDKLIKEFDSFNDTLMDSTDMMFQEYNSFINSTAKERETYFRNDDEKSIDQYKNIVNEGNDQYNTNIANEENDQYSNIESIEPFNNAILENDYDSRIENDYDSTNDIDNNNDIQDSFELNQETEYIKHLDQEEQEAIKELESLIKTMKENKNNSNNDNQLIQQNNERDENIYDKNIDDLLTCPENEETYIENELIQLLQTLNEERDKHDNLLEKIQSIKHQSFVIKTETQSIKEKINMKRKDKQELELNIALVYQMMMETVYQKIDLIQFQIKSEGKRRNDLICLIDFNINESTNLRNDINLIMKELEMNRNQKDCLEAWFNDQTPNIQWLNQMVKEIQIKIGNENDNHSILTLKSNDLLKTIKEMESQNTIIRFQIIKERKKHEEITQWFSDIEPDLYEAKVTGTESLSLIQRELQKERLIFRRLDTELEDLTNQKSKLVKYLQPLKEEFNVYKDDLVWLNDSILKLLTNIHELEEEKLIIKESYFDDIKENEFDNNLDDTILQGSIEYQQQNQNNDEFIHINQQPKDSLNEMVQYTSQETLYEQDQKQNIDNNKDTMNKTMNETINDTINQIDIHLPLIKDTNPENIKKKSIVTHITSLSNYNTIKRIPTIQQHKEHENPIKYFPQIIHKGPTVYKWDCDQKNDQRIESSHSSYSLSSFGDYEMIKKTKWENIQSKIKLPEIVNLKPF